VSTQYVGEAALCDLVAVMAEGRVLVVDTPEGLRRHAFGDELDRMQEPPSYDDVFVRLIEADRARAATAEAA